MLSKLDTYKSIAQAFHTIAQDLPESVCYSQSQITQDNQRIWQSENYAQIQLKVNRLANYLQSIGLKAGDKVAIVALTRPEWMIADLAIQTCAAVTVSIYHSLSAQDAGYILYDSGAKIVFVENQEQSDKIVSLSESEFTIPQTESHQAKSVKLQFEKIISFEKISGNAATGICQYQEIIVNPNISDETPQTYKNIQRNDLAALVYTSGTTGPAKGVMQTHGNHLTNVRQAGETGLFALDGDIFLFLPLAHSFARLLAYIGFLTPARLKFPAISSKTNSIFDPESITTDLRQGSAQVVPAVPRIFEKMLDGLRNVARKKSLSSFLLRLCLNSSNHVYQAKLNDRPVGVLQNLIYEGTASLRTKIKHKLFGPNFSHGVSGGAKLPSNIGHFFASLGITILEGYGLTETCVATNVNRLEKNKIGSVGPCMKDLEIKLTEENEICFRGPQITVGYYNRPQATKESWDQDNWFHTGDLGYLDQDGYLYINGRKKELIVTAGGKKIPPTPIEDKLRFSKYISQAVLYGEGKPYCVVLLTLDLEVIKTWAKDQGLVSDKSVNIITQLFNNVNIIRKIDQLIGQEIESVNQTLSHHETIKKFRIIADDFSIENGLLTPTLKVKKNDVIKKYSNLIDEMYKN